MFKGLKNDTREILGRMQQEGSGLSGYRGFGNEAFLVVEHLIVKGTSGFVGGVCGSKQLLQGFPNVFFGALCSRGLHGADPNRPAPRTTLVHVCRPTSI